MQSHETLVKTVLTQRQTSSIYWAELNRLQLKTGTESRLRNAVLNKMDNVQNCELYYYNLSLRVSFHWCRILLILYYVFFFCFEAKYFL